jgi:glycosyltransferase involved in cell wall biosynthesis
MTRDGRLRALYICYLSLEDPLVHTQVVAYLRGLARAGHEIHLLSFETGRLTRATRRRWRAELARVGISWYGLRYHKRPSLLATIYDTFAGALLAAWLVRRHRLDALHARSHVPAAMALMARGLCWPKVPKLIFDIRGLWAEEYVDAGRWRKGGVPWRLTKAVERRGIAEADGIVVLTERIRSQLFDAHSDKPVWVIPCCGDVERLELDAKARERKRAELGVGSATVMAYVGKFGGWYMAAEMIRFFALATTEIPRLHFLILTQGSQDEIRSELATCGLGESCYTLGKASPEEIGEYLAAADFGISFIRPDPSKASTSPTKIGEYLAAGLPVASTAGVGDLDALISSDVGVLIHQHNEDAYLAAARHIRNLLTAADTRQKCIALAHKKLSLSEVGIPRYRQLYESVAL